jgi:hypothetical protein
MDKKIKYLITSLLVPIFLGVGCGNQKSSETQPNQQITKTDKKSRNLKKNSYTVKYNQANLLAEKNKSIFKESINGIQRLDRGENYSYSPGTPQTVAEMAKDAYLTARVLITNTEFIIVDNQPRTIYTAFIEEVYVGDQSKKGQTIKIELPGGKIQNSILYAAYQEKSFIPDDKKLTPEQLNEYTVIQADGHDPAEPGDEMISTYSPYYDEIAKETVHATPAQEVTFYKAKGTDKFIVHHSNIKPVGGNDNTGKSNSLTGRAGSRRSTPNKEEQQIKKNEADINSLVSTKKVPQP